MKLYDCGALISSKVTKAGGGPVEEFLEWKNGLYTAGNY